ncbi:MarR family winged helix-turn-helix transcriptional regulator [Lentibacillus salicampi]|uniref:MarR family transcriptional regulator n=1 Tax=Lentibacillus salicampi TaxID=175306 RepID=A0A4Y9AEY6_9BACI|nr:MarR family transcriptional regulator [Lentibacillus salicampi]TFJ94386.1 MarR family transcriptional regulator [Lentibacillus salicampi]
MKKNDSQPGTQIAGLFREINAVFNQQLRKGFKDIDITPPQMMILHYLYKREECKVSDISGEFNLAPSTVSSILDRLEKQGLVVRERLKTDKRVVQILLSEKAVELKDSLKGVVNGTMEKMTQCASREETDQIIDGLKLMKDVLSRNGFDKGE